MHYWQRNTWTFSLGYAGELITSNLSASPLGLVVLIGRLVFWKFLTTVYKNIISSLNIWIANFKFQNYFKNKWSQNWKEYTMKCVTLSIGNTKKDIWKLVFFLIKKKVWKSLDLLIVIIWIDTCTLTQFNVKWSRQGL